MTTIHDASPDDDYSDAHTMGLLIQQVAYWKRGRKYAILTLFFLGWVTAGALLQLVSQNFFWFAQVAVAGFLWGKIPVRKIIGELGRRGMWEQQSIILGTAAAHRGSPFNMPDRTFMRAFSSTCGDINGMNAQERCAYIEKMLHIIPVLSVEMQRYAAAHVALLAYSTKIPRRWRRRGRP